jgi:hypothetical protein
MVFSISLVLWFRWIFNIEIGKGKHYRLDGYFVGCPGCFEHKISMRQRFAGLFNKSALQS